MNQRQTRFTLIEMLVVIAIIGVLASILMPALSNARGSALQLSCVNNVGQITKAHHMYANDFNGWIVQTTNHAPTNPSALPFVRHNLAIAGGNKAMPAPNPPEYIPPGNTFICPANDNMPKFIGLSYGMYLGRNDTDYSSKSSWTGDFMYTAHSAMTLYNLPRFRAPSQVPMMADTVTTTTANYVSGTYGINESFYGKMYWHWTPTSISSLTEMGGIHMLHLNRTNLSFFDGHAASHGVNELTALRFGIKYAYTQDLVSLKLQ